MKKIPTFIQLEKLTLQEFVILIKSTFNKIDKDGKPYIKISYRKKFWIHLIETNNLICPITGKKVSYCSYDRQEYKNIINIPTFHYNFYSEDDELFSIDHKYPISKGGSKYSVDNIQPMIMLENFKKENKLIFI